MAIIGTLNDLWRNTFTLAELFFLGKFITRNHRKSLSGMNMPRKSLHQRRSIPRRTKWGPRTRYCWYTPSPCRKCCHACSPYSPSIYTPVLLVLDMWYSNYNRQTNLMLNTLDKYHVFLKCPFLLNPMPVNTLPVPLILILICSFFWYETFYKQRGSNCKHGAYRIQLSGAFGYINIFLYGTNTARK
jgi:hypothetical protein